MKKIGDIISQANTAAGVPVGLPAVPRPHRVSVCYMVFAELCLVAEDARAARAKALEHAKHAKRKFAAEPFVYRTEVCERKDPVTGEPIWSEIDKPGEAR